MTPWQNRATDLTRRMADDMRVRNYSQRTIDAYTYHVGRFAQFLGRSPLEATPEDVRSFQLHMIEVRKLSWSGFNQAVCGLRFLFGTTSPKSWPFPTSTASGCNCESAAARDRKHALCRCHRGY